MFNRCICRNVFIQNYLISKRHAGHSKWANIKHIKGQKDMERSKLFERFCRRMKVAILEGGSYNPNSNTQLAQIIESAKKHSMPSSTIENFLKKAQTDKAKLSNVIYEVKGLKGVICIVSAITDNHKKTRETLSTILRKNNGSFADHSGKYHFENKGVIIAIPPPDLANPAEATVDHAIDCGAEEVNPLDTDQGTYQFICERADLPIVKGKLEALKYSVQDTSLDFIPNNLVSLSDEEMELMSKLIEKIEEHPDVVRVFDNIQ